MLEVNVKYLILISVVILSGCSSVSIIDSENGCIVTVRESVTFNYVSDKCEVTVNKEFE